MNLNAKNFYLNYKSYLRFEIWILDLKKSEKEFLFFRSIN